MEKNPSKQEWLIMEALWKKSPMFLSEIMLEMNTVVNWKQTTYSTYLKKMTDAGLLGFNTISSFRQYYPLVSREECVKSESRSVRAKLSDDSARLFLACMIREGGLNEQDRAELKDLISALDEQEEQ